MFFTAIGGFIAGYAANEATWPAQAAFPVNAIALSNVIFLTISFIIIGSRITGPRWKHLVIVAVVCWLVSALNMIFFQSTLNATWLMWFQSLLLILVTMGVGGGLSYIFNRK